MDRRLIVSLLQSSIEELGLMTKGFMEMSDYPAPIIQLARRKTEDVLNYLQRLEEIKSRTPDTDVPAASSLPHEEEKSDSRAGEAAEVPTDVKAEPPKEEETTCTTEAEEVVPHVQAQVEIQSDEPEVQSNEPVKAETPLKVSPVATLRMEETPPRPEAITILHTDNSLAGVHTLKKIDDIRQAISIGDRFRFQRELFAGNGEQMNKTLAKLNRLDSFDQAVAYLQSKFDWDMSDETVDNFLQIVRRRW